MEFAVVITDLRRDTVPDVGKNLIATVKAGWPDLPLVVYTDHAEPLRAGLIATGAAAVVDVPCDLISPVQAHRPGSCC